MVANMDNLRRIDITFDFRSDTPQGRDPDSFSPMLRRYHKILWSKPLPSGDMFALDDSTAKYLQHSSQLGDFVLTSDAVIPTFWKERRIKDVIGQIPVEEREAFSAISYTIGGMMLFPGNRVDGKMTINGARGCHPLIKDRFDLTVECIRRHYVGGQSPLSGALARYHRFFELFGDFHGYVDFFHLQDIVTRSYTSAKFFMPFDDFSGSPLPTSISAYTAYRQLAVEFIEARNWRIVQSY